MNGVQRYERLDMYGVGCVGTAVTDADGFMRDSPVVARTGVYVYQQPDGTIRKEYRPEEEVFNEDSLGTFEGKPITVGHPKDGKVTAATARKLSIGSILSRGYIKGGVPNSPKYVSCDIVLFSPKAIGDARQLSLGYRCDIEEVSGVTPDGEEYDAIQRNIRVNHLAVVKKARAGIKARLNLDGDEVYDLEESEKKKMRITIDSKEYDIDESVATYINALKIKEENARIKLDAATSELESAKADNEKLKENVDEKQKEIDEVSAERDGLKAKNESAEEEKKKAVDEAVEKTRKEMEEHKEAQDCAEKAKIGKTDGLSTAELKNAIIKSAFGESFKIDGMSEAYINGAYNAAKEMLHNDDFKHQAAKAKGVGQNNDNSKNKNDSADDARRAMIERQLNAYKNDERCF